MLGPVGKRRHFSRCWPAPVAPVISHWRGRGRNSTSSFYIEAGGYKRARAMITLCANCSYSRGRRVRPSAALLFVDRDADRDNPNRGPSLVVAAAHSMPATASSSPVRFLLTAREGGLWVDRSRQEGNSRSLSPHSPGLAPLCARRPPAPVLAAPKAAKLALLYSGANSPVLAAWGDAG